MTRAIELLEKFRVLSEYERSTKFAKEVWDFDHIKQVRAVTRAEEGPLKKRHAVSCHMCLIVFTDDSVAFFHYGYQDPINNKTHYSVARTKAQMEIAHKEVNIHTDGLRYDRVVKPTL